MRLIHSLVNTIIDFGNEEKVNMLVVENQNLFTQLLTDLYNQINKQGGDFILSFDSSPVEISKNMELITELIPFEINKRNLLSKLYKKADLISKDESFILPTKELIAYINKYANELAEYIDFDIDFSIEYDVSYILKAIDFKFKDDYSSISEKIIEYMILVRELEGDKCFVVVNLRNYISDDKIDELYKTILYNKLKVLILSANDYKSSPFETKTIIDNDLCEF